MSLFSRVVNVFRGEKAGRDIDEEQESHLEEAVRQGRDTGAARRAFGSALRQREQSRDIRLVPWLDSLRADIVFGWRQLRKHQVASAAAILSLGIAIGACTSAYRLIDALLLRPLPVAHPEELYSLSRIGLGFDAKPHTFDSWAYPDFQLMRAAVRGRAELIAVSYAERMDLTFRSDAEMEKAQVQYVSGRMFRQFGLQPALGRLFTEDDDRKPRAHPYAVLSCDYWTQRFGQDRSVLGRTFRMGDDIYQVVGVTAGPFTGTEPGTMADVFVPTMMHRWVTRDDATWFRTFARVNPGIAIEPLRQQLDATSQGFEEERAKGFTGMSSASRKRFIDQTLLMDPAAAGTSGLQQEYRRALGALAVLVALVLLIACANVANLLSAQAAARAREMALRVSIGAGRMRLMQLVLIESAWLGVLAAATGAFFAWWSAPFVVSRINPPDNPARIVLPADWTVLAFGLGLTIAVTLLFGLAPALRASSVKPASALKGGEDPHSRRRLMNALVALQVAFCFSVIFVAGLFAASFDRLSHRPIGMSTDRLLTIETVSQRPQPAAHWDQMADHLRLLPGVEKVAFAGWSLPGGNSWNGFLSINGAPPGPVLAYLLPISPGWLETMKIHLVAGRDFRESDVSPGSAIVNEAFVKQFFPHENALGKFFLRGTERSQIVGVTTDVPYRSLRESTLPVAYLPFHARMEAGAVQTSNSQTFIVRTASQNPLALASFLRREIPAFQPAFRVSNIRTQLEWVQAQTVLERLLAMLALFFAVVALLLAGLGLYGVLDYSVLQRRREIGIRRAIGAQGASIARLVTVTVFSMVFLGVVAGMGLSLTSAHAVETLLYQVKPGEWSVLALPVLTILGVSLLAGAPAVVRAIRIDPAQMLRSD